MQEQAKCKHYSCKKTDQANIYLGCGVYDSMCIAQPLSAQHINIFGRSFGIYFPLTCGDTTETAVRQVSSFEHASIFPYTDKVTCKLAEQKYWPLLEDNIPTHSYTTIINCVYERLLILRPFCSMFLNQHIIHPPLMGLQAKLVVDKPPPCPRLSSTRPLARSYQTRQLGKMLTLPTHNVV